MIKINLQYFGGRGASSGSSVAGMFSSGTDEQLETATENLNKWIAREKKIVDDRQNYYKVMEKKRADEFLKGHEKTLKELNAQKKELEKEKAKRAAQKPTRAV